MDLRVVEVQVGLMRVEAVPIVGFGHRIPRPVRGLEVFENDARFLVFFRRIAPDIHVAFGRTGRCAARFLKPRVMIGGVVDHQFRDHLQAALVRRGQKRLEIGERSVVRVYVVIVGDVVAIIAQGRGIKGQQPESGHAQLLEVIELFDQAAKIADAISIAVMEGLNVQLVDYGVLVPERIDDGITR